MKNIQSIIICIVIFINAHAQTPSMFSFSPSRGYVGSLITITGTNLNFVNNVSIGGSNSILVSKTASSIIVMVMPGTLTGKVVLNSQFGMFTSNNNFNLLTSRSSFIQNGNKLLGSGSSIYGAGQGCSIALSADGNTALVGGFWDDNYKGAVWVYIKSGSLWVQQGSKLVGFDSGGNGNSMQGYSLALSADGNTAIIGGPQDNFSTGAVWIFIRIGNIWSQQGSKLVGAGATGNAQQGWSVSLSADGNTALIGGYSDDNGKGAAWIYTRSGIVWSQQGNKLLGSGATINAAQGSSVCISADGNTAIVGGYGDNNAIGAAWIYVRTGQTWNQQGNKLVGIGSTQNNVQGKSVSINADGTTAIVSGDWNHGAAWVYVRNGSTWSQQGNKLTISGNTGYYYMGSSISISADGNIAIIGGDAGNNDGGAWVFTRNNNVWSQKGNMIVGSNFNWNCSYNGNQYSVAISADGNTSMFGDPDDNCGFGATWMLNSPITKSSYLANLDLGNAILTPSFSSDSLFYNSIVSNKDSVLFLSSLLDDNNAKTLVQVNGGMYLNYQSGGQAIPIIINTGSNTINIKVTAQDSTSMRTYNITVIRQVSSNADLSSLVLSQANLIPSYKNTKIAYNTVVANATNSITVTAMSSINFSTMQVRVNGGAYSTLTNGIASSALNLNIGSNTIDVRVTAQDGITVKTYSVNITRVGIVSSLNLSVKAYLQGLYTGHGSMISALNKANGNLPINIADTIILELINPTDNSLAYSILTLLDTLGNTMLTLPGSFNGHSYYIVLKHRNSIETWSANPIGFNGNLNYDFTSSYDKALGNNLSDMGNGIFAIYSGDINQDGSIDFSDYPDLDIANNSGVLGYNVNDLNGDASVDFNDFPILDINSNNGIIAMRP